MVLFVLAVLTASAGEIKLKYYSVVEEIIDDTQWMIEGEEGWYLCTARTSCPGMAKEAELITGREVWYDPIMVFYQHEGKRTRCMLETCVRPRPLTYQDL